MVLKDRRRNERNLSGLRKPLYFCYTRKHDQHDQLLDLLIVSIIMEEKKLLNGSI